MYAGLEAAPAPELAALRQAQRVVASLGPASMITRLILVILIILVTYIYIYIYTHIHTYVIYIYIYIYCSCLDAKAIV